jgi:pyruvate,orthophosphate dikinase
MTKQYVYFFGGNKAEGNAEMKDLLGGKGANLAEMVNLGIPVPPGFTITTEVCTYQMNKEKFPSGLKEEIAENLKRVEDIMESRFGDSYNPLLVSVRSGAKKSMPGMMDTVLNIGLNETTLEGLINRTHNPRFAWDAYRRFIQMYTNVVMGVSGRELEHILDHFKKQKKAEKDVDLTVEDLQELIGLYKRRLAELNVTFPEKPWDQLFGGISAVFKSWNTPRAVTYRKLNNIPDDWGTACNVQAMVFGNMGNNSATGVAFTRDPATGESRFFGEWLPNAQGEDVVAGIRTPYPINRENKKAEDEICLEEYMPAAYNSLVRIYKKLEAHYKDMQDIEFTIQERKLWMLQTRTGKRTGFAAVRMAVEMCDEGLIDKETAVERVEPEALIQLLAPIFEAAEKKKAVSAGRFLAKGLNAGPGAATGRVVFSADDAVKKAKSGPVLLVRLETSPEDIHGMAVAQGILTGRGGMTSHAALVARGMGKPCIVGCSALDIDHGKKLFKAAGKTVKEGDWLSIDGTTGEVIAGQLKTYPSEVVQVLIEKKLKPEKSLVFRNFNKILGWADELRKLGVRCNADTPHDAAAGMSFSAQGIGLCRTEHMFFEGDRIDAVREMILASDTEGRKKALSKILPMQKGDFVGIFKAMPGLPITIRLLDPPLHEFLPHTDKEINALAKKIKHKPAELKAKVQQLHEFNPMLGHRGCRLAITFPEIYDLQVRAIIEAAVEVKKKNKIDVKPEIMIPIVGHKKELDIIRERSEKIIKEILGREQIELPCHIGTMVELPRAVVAADKIAQTAEFFSFGTNDLTQTVLGMSRDDAGSFLPEYVEQGIYQRDPFETIDQEGVGEMMRLGVEKGRATRPDLKIGICGEHGGEPESVIFCHKIALDYVSCSPYRVPVARMAAAHAVLRERKEAKQQILKAKEKSRTKKAEAKTAKPAQSRPLRFPPAARKAEVARKAEAEAAQATEKAAAKASKKPAAKKPAPPKPVPPKAPAPKVIVKPALKKAAPKAAAKKAAKPKPAAKKAKPAPKKPAPKKTAAKKVKPKAAAKKTQPAKKAVKPKAKVKKALVKAKPKAAPKKSVKPKAAKKAMKPKAPAKKPKPQAAKKPAKPKPKAKAKKPAKKKR